MATEKSFRDPAGFVVVHDNRVYRLIYHGHEEEVGAIVSSDFFRDAVDRGEIIGSRELPRKQACSVLQSVAEPAMAAKVATIYEHELVPFVSYPHEWGPSMLYSAGDLTIRLHQEALTNGLMLKDASAGNIQFIGTRPVLVDILSLVRRSDEDPIWPAYGQYVRNFILPLLVYKLQGTGPREVFLGSRDGLDPAAVYPRLNWFQRLRPVVLSTVSLPHWLAGFEVKTTCRKTSGEDSKIIASFLAKGLSEKLRSLKPRVARSKWTTYQANRSYSPDALKVKANFIATTMGQWRPVQVLDVGCNLGEYSTIAARLGAYVVAIDSDSSAVDCLFNLAKGPNDKILALSVDLAWPSPPLGWCCREIQGFLERSTQKFDSAILVAVIHHLCLTENIPLIKIFRLLASIVTKGIIIEHISPEDLQLLRISKGKEHLIYQFQRNNFESALASMFTIENGPVSVGPSRSMYSAIPKPIGGRSN